GPEATHPRQFSPDSFTDRYQTPWGEAINFDGPGSDWVRRFFCDNAAYWLTEYHVDGLRLDAVHCIYDRSPKHVLQEIQERARAAVPPGRSVFLSLESHDNDVRLIRPTPTPNTQRPAPGTGYDAVWADDFHHAVRAYLTGEQDGYFADYAGRIETIARTIEAGFLYQGEYSRYWGFKRGTRVTDEPGRAFVF